MFLTDCLVCICSLGTSFYCCQEGMEFEILMLLFTPTPDLGIMLKLKKMLYTTNRQKVQNCG